MLLGRVRHSLHLSKRHVVDRLQHPKDPCLQDPLTSAIMTSLCEIPDAAGAATRQERALARV